MNMICNEHIGILNHLFTIEERTCTTNAKDDSTTNKLISAKVDDLSPYRYQPFRV